MRATHEIFFLDPCNYAIACFLDRWQEKSLFLKLLVVDVVTSATFAIGKLSKLIFLPGTIFLFISQS